MGNHHSQGAASRGAAAQGGAECPAAAGVGGGSRKDKPLSRSASGADIQDSTHLLPVDRLAKMLQRRTQQEQHVQGISGAVFTRYVFPRYGELGDKLWAAFRTRAGATASKAPQMSASAFRQQAERLLTVLEDEAELEWYVRMYADDEQMTPDGLRLLLMTAYRVAMDHYSEGPQMCLHIQKTLATVVDSCFHHKQRLSAHYVSHWLLVNCGRLLSPLHRYVVHRLTTAHRELDGAADAQPDAANIRLTTPVLEQPPPWGDAAANARRHGQQTGLLAMSRAWLLAAALSPLYSRPRETPAAQQAAPPVRFLSRLLAAVPSHWVQLYCSEQHGRGANRFMHHVLNYRGPTVTLLGAQCGAVFCVAAPSEWHESHLYWGGEDCAVFQLYPRFALVERGPKMLFLNTSIRGYPQGLRAGKDPRKPIVSVDGGFDKMECQSIPYALASVEVWGCGDQTQRDTQLDIKRWQVKEAERQRCVKLSAADWLDHPDRYLLELAGRPQYNNRQSQPQ